MKVAAPSLAPILRSDTQGRILARLLADPDKSFNLSELTRHCDDGEGGLGATRQGQR